VDKALRRGNIKIYGFESFFRVIIFLVRGDTHQGNAFGRDIGVDSVKDC
jgi:hypothetical protein